ncbi:MAG: hypothetical protein SFU98_03605 [Leptospiraceae bacterium]|nr:hypothetical protein [Leptospiraceae bacterium]
MKKNIILSAILAIATVNCGSIPRMVLLEAKDTAQPYELAVCGLQITVPAGWAIEKDATSINDVYVTKDKIDIHVDYMATEKDATKIGADLEKKIEKDLKTDMKVNRVAKKKVNGIEAATIYGMAPGNVSIDIDTFNCPIAGSVAFYVVSPANTWKRDRGYVEELLRSVKLISVKK